MVDTDRKRPLLAAALTLPFPGLGHLYLREWFRALLWFGLAVTATQLLVPAPPVPDTFTLDTVVAAYGSVELSVRAQAVLVGLTTMSMLDAYWVAAAGNRAAAAAEGVRCPTCGKEVDEDLEFCHWCTTELVDPADETPPDETPVEQ